MQTSCAAILILTSCFSAIRTGKKIDKDFLFTEDRIYANTGAWCEDDASCVIIEKFPLKSGIIVKLVNVGVDGSVTNTHTRRL